MVAPGGLDKVTFVLKAWSRILYFKGAIDDFYPGPKEPWTVDTSTAPDLMTFLVYFVKR